MKVKRIVAHVDAADPAAAKRVYKDILGLDVLMDMGWIATYDSQESMSIQISFMSEGGSGAPVPDLSIEVESNLFYPADSCAGRSVLPAWGVARPCRPSHSVAVVAVVMMNALFLIA